MTEINTALTSVDKTQRCHASKKLFTF